MQTSKIVLKSTTLLLKMYNNSHTLEVLSVHQEAQTKKYRQKKESTTGIFHAQTGLEE